MVSKISRKRSAIRLIEDSIDECSPSHHQEGARNIKQQKRPRLSPKEVFFLKGNSRQKCRNSGGRKTLARCIQPENRPVESVELPGVAVSKENEGNQAHKIEMQHVWRAKALDQNKSADDEGIDADDLEIQPLAKIPLKGWTNDDWIESNS